MPEVNRYQKLRQADEVARRLIKALGIGEKSPEQMAQAEEEQAQHERDLREMKTDPNGATMQNKVMDITRTGFVGTAKVLTEAQKRAQEGETLPGEKRMVKERNVSIYKEKVNTELKALVPLLGKRLAFLVEIFGDLKKNPNKLGGWNLRKEKFETSHSAIGLSNLEPAGSGSELEEQVAGLESEIEKYWEELENYVNDNEELRQQWLTMTIAESPIRARLQTAQKTLDREGKK